MRTEPSMHLTVLVPHKEESKTPWVTSLLATQPRCEYWEAGEKQIGDQNYSMTSLQSGGIRMIIHNSKQHHGAPRNLHWKKPLRSSSPTVNWALPSLPRLHILLNTSSMVTSLSSLFQCFRIFSFSKEFFCNIQPKLPVAQLCHMSERI